MLADKTFYELYPRLVVAQRKCRCASACRTADYALLFQRKTGRRPTIYELMSYTGKSKRTIYRHKKRNVYLRVAGLKRSSRGASKTRHKICEAYIDCVNKDIYPSAPTIAKRTGLCERTVATYLYGKGKEEWEQDIQYYTHKLTQMPAMSGKWLFVCVRLIGL